jgi:hypothetical protein
VEWVNVIGLAYDIAGAVVLSIGLFLSEEDALKLGRGPELTAGTREGDLQLATVQDRQRQSLNAIRGVALLVVGFLLQIIAAWPT